MRSKVDDVYIRFKIITMYLSFVYFWDVCILFGGFEIDKYSMVHPASDQSNSSIGLLDFSQPCSKHFYGTFVPIYDLLDWLTFVWYAD